MGTAIAVVGTAGGVVMLLWASMGAGWGAIWAAMPMAAMMIAVSVGISVLIRLALKIEANTSRLHGVTHELCERLEDYHRTLTAIAENTALSDSAKSIVSRAKEREALRGVIHEEIRKEDFESVFHLIDDLEQRLGYRDEAERLRQETREECAEAFRSKLKAALEHVTKLLGARRWGHAGREIERLEKLMPNEPRVRELWELLETRRDEYKQVLMGEWNKAAGESNVEKGIELLGELDQYLTGDEARALQSTAREFYKERLQQLGVQFQFAVKEKRWRDGLAVALQIIEDFPNARMAAELRERLEALRTRAGIPTNVEVTARSEAASPASP
ncbi:MAG: hypothetical protein HOP29_10570 [Phycisphaerales bacterium]|nr:hypothetical protein [Phycisphaerales bacterium]